MHNSSKGTYRYGFFTFTTVKAADEILKVKNFRFRGKKMAVKRINKNETGGQASSKKCPVHNTSKFINDSTAKNKKRLQLSNSSSDDKFKSSHTVSSPHLNLNLKFNLEAIANQMSGKINRNHLESNIVFSNTVQQKVKRNRAPKRAYFTPFQRFQQPYIARSAQLRR